LKYIYILEDLSPAH